MKILITLEEIYNDWNEYYSVIVYNEWMNAHKLIQCSYLNFGEYCSILQNNGFEIV